MRAELSNLSHCAVPFLIRAAASLCTTSLISVRKKLKKVTISTKKSLLNWVKIHGVTNSVSDLKEGEYLPGFVRDVQQYGSFIETAGGLLGLCPKACLSDDFVMKPEDIFTLNESVVCKITNTDKEKGRFLASTKMSDMRKEDSMLSGHLLNSYFTSLASFGELAPGLFYMLGYL